MLTTPHSLLLIIRNISDKSCRENQNTYFMFNIFLFFLENLDIYEIIWKNTVSLGKPQMTVWRMFIACWIPKATNRHSGCVTLIACPLQQWLHECAWMLRYTYIACFVVTLACVIALWLPSSLRAVSTRSLCL